MVYAKDEQKAIILYMNELDKSELTRDVVVGSSGEKIDYSTDEQIANLLKQGYELVNDGYTKPLTTLTMVTLTLTKSSKWFFVNVWFLSTQICQHQLQVKS